MTMLPWPKSVAMPEQAGTGSCYLVANNGRSYSPNCALGHFYTAFGVKGPDEYYGDCPQDDFERMYVKVATAKLEARAAVCYSKTVPTINDRELGSDYERALVYNATMACLGYTEGQSDEVLELTKKVKPDLLDN